MSTLRVFAFSEDGVSFFGQLDSPYMMQIDATCSKGKVPTVTRFYMKMQECLGTTAPLCINQQAIVERYIFERYEKAGNEEMLERDEDGFRIPLPLLPVSDEQTYDEWYFELLADDAEWERAESLGRAMRVVK